MLFVLGLSVLILSCTQNRNISHQGKLSPTQVFEGIHQDSLMLNKEEGLVYYQGAPFSGSAYQYYVDSLPAIFSEYLRGKRHGLYQKWFPDGSISYEVSYLQGKMEGIAKTWWNNGNFRSETPFKEGLTEGTQIQYYRSGALFKKRRLVAGREEGLQQAWRENGKIYNNYEAKNGRIFGLKRANLCYEISDESVTYRAE